MADEAQTPGDDHAAPELASATGQPRQIGGSMGRAVAAATSGEELTAESVMRTIGGWRGVAETVIPAFVFIVVFAITKEARTAALGSGALAIVAVIVRLVQRETIVAALSGALGVGIAVLITLITGRGVDYFLSGFIVNAAWSLGLLISIIAGWPAIGLILGFLRGDMTGWRKDKFIRRAAVWLTTLWLLLFLGRLAVQFPMYLANQVEMLGVARIVMGIPLFAACIVVTWLVLRKLPKPDEVESRSAD
ncbi:DUF3159 domain-containing protein [Leucobacter sp. cx-42]|uniref:DUF3159 domain-containing protein n=1 Tax=unclassified Leucobacter TaxID=2621730 RepID=UPI00165E8736|nr:MULTISPECIES: DUF3159 domain-containing protein [unclassified Leucobacter]MBC9954883.1 DUF3159 domain-containing protein [Leucobacter sp. cx-42]